MDSSALGVGGAQVVREHGVGRGGVGRGGQVAELPAVDAVQVSLAGAAEPLPSESGDERKTVVVDREPTQPAAFPIPSAAAPPSRAQRTARARDLPGTTVSL